MPGSLSWLATLAGEMGLHYVSRLFKIKHFVSVKKLFWLKMK